jgi:hypothetical protein
MSVLTDNTAKLRKILEKVENLPEMPPSVAQATPTISVSSGGLITATATQEAGAVAAGTKSATRQLTTKGGTTITPGDDVQTAVSAGTFVTGDILVAAAAGESQVVIGTATSTSSTLTLSPGFPIRALLIYYTGNVTSYIGQGGNFIDGVGTMKVSGGSCKMNKTDNGQGSTFTLDKVPGMSTTSRFPGSMTYMAVS